MMQRRQSALKSLLLDGLDEVIVETGRARALEILGVAVTRDGDETKACKLRHRAQCLGKLIAAHAGQPVLPQTSSRASISRASTIYASW